MKPIRILIVGLALCVVPGVAHQKSSRLDRGEDKSSHTKVQSVADESSSKTESGDDKPSHIKLEVAAATLAVGLLKAWWSRPVRPKTN